MAIKTRKTTQKSEYKKKLSWLRKNKTPKHILEVELEYSENDLRRILAISEELRIIRNTVVGLLFKNYKQMIRTKKYKDLMLDIKNINLNIKNLNNESKSYKKELNRLEKEKKTLYLKLDNLKEEFNVTFEYARKYGEFLREKKFKKADAVLVLSACENAFKSMERIMYGNANKPRFISKGEFFTLQGKQAERCIILKKDKEDDSLFITHSKMNFDLKIKKNDLFVIETLSNIKKYMEKEEEINNSLVDAYNSTQEILNTYRICNNRIVIKEIRGKKRLFAQIVLEGNPVPKRRKDGSFRHKLGVGKIGGDIGTQSVALASEDIVELKNLAERSRKSTFNLEREITNIQRYLDRSRRATNPKNYKEDGTIIKGKKVWIKSNRYKAKQLKLKELHRKASESRKYATNEDINYIRSIGDTLIMEKMIIQGLQKKSKEVTKNSKGRFNRRKRFGKSILNRCPGYFISQSKYRFNITGGTVKEVNTWTFKASQYDHKIDACNKKSLSKRWHVFEDGTMVQRDIYSSFLLLCSNDELDAPNKDMCDKLFEKFLLNHDKCIEKIKKNKIKVLNSGIKIA